MKNTQQLNKIIKTLYNVWLVRGCKMYRDTDWSNVRNLVNIFKYVGGVNSINCSAGKYHNYINKVNNTDLPYRDYDLTVDTEYGQIEGYIRCCAAGSEDDPFSTYDIVVSFWKSDKEMNESFGGRLHIREMLDAISRTKNVEDLKAVAHKYVKEVATVGTFLTLALSFANLTEPEYRDLASYTTENTIEWQTTPSYDEDEDATSFEEAPQIEDWVLVAGDVHTTIYHATASQCNSDYKHTASMFELNLKNPQGHKIIAMERTMMQKYNLHFGDLVKIEGTGDLDGVYQIQDVMNSRFRGENHIDILVNTTMKHGQWWNIKLYKLNNPELAQELKSQMKPAVNQKSVDKRQTQYDLLADAE